MKVMVCWLGNGKAFNQRQGQPAGGARAQKQKQLLPREANKTRQLDNTKHSQAVHSPRKQHSQYQLQPFRQSALSLQIQTESAPAVLPGSFLLGGLSQSAATTQ